MHRPQIAVISCSHTAPPLLLLLPALSLMCWRLAALHSSGAVDMWHVIFALASLCVAVSRQWGGVHSVHRGSSQGGSHGFGVKVTKKWDDSLFEPSDVDASGARCSPRVCDVLSGVSFSPAVAQEKLLQRSFIDATDVEEVLLHSVPVSPAMPAVLFSSHAFAVRRKRHRNYGKVQEHCARLPLFSSHLTSPFPVSFFFPRIQFRRHQRRRLQAKKSVMSCC